MLIDGHRRRIDYLRLSLTDRCDLRCAYCMPRDMTFLPRSDLLTIGELEQVARAFIARGVRRIRLTGGEPLVRRGALDLVRALGKEIGRDLDELTLTTNGTQLAAHAGELASAGVRRVNVSLDTLDRARFAALTGADRLPDVLAGIAAARSAGLEVKINTVALQGFVDELPSLIAWAHGEGHAVTLIEVMPLGDIPADRADQFVSLSEVKHSLDRRWTLRPTTYRTAGPARYFDVVETGGRLGFITPLSDNFCSECNRVRVTATGRLNPCLGAGEAIDLRAAVRSADGHRQLDLALDRAMRIKPERHAFSVQRGAPPAVARHMSVTGG